MKNITRMMKWLFVAVLSVFISESRAQCPTIACPPSIMINVDPAVCGAVVNFTEPVGTNPCGTITDTFYYTGSLQTYTVPLGITMITIEASGAQGGSVTTTCAATGGLGARIQGDVAVTPGEVLTILVGQQGLTNGSDAGGGGGSFVVRAGNVPLIVAGGGGGATNNITACGTSRDGLDASITNDGTASGNGLVAGGTGGNGGGASTGSGGGGGGFYTDGVAGTGLAGNNGKSFLNGGAGGTGNNNDFGGYGGGGAGWFTGGNGGGGGGYSGGGTSGSQPFTGGGGGGSYNIGSNPINTPGAQTGNGLVRITFTDPGSVQQTAGLVSGSTFPVGVTLQKFRVTDYLGNQDSCFFIVTVIDNEAPVPDVAVLPDLVDECSVTAIPPTATDACEGTIVATTSDSLQYESQGNFVIHWVYEDSHGNAVTANQNVVINDITVPTFSCPMDTVVCEGFGTLNLIPQNVMDNCVGEVSIAYELSGATSGIGVNDASSEPFNVGMTQVTYFFEDGNGNIDSCSFSVTVNPTYLFMESDSICLGDTLLWHGMNLFTAGTFYDDYYSVSGCDSTYGVDLFLRPLPTVSFSGLNSFYCDYNAADSLVGLPLGGIFTGSGITGNVFNPALAGIGNFDIVYSYADVYGCSNSDTLNVTVDNCFGIDQREASSLISLFPNPSDGSFTLQLIEDANVQIYNVLGGLVYSQSLTKGKHALSLNEAKGVYYLKASNANGTTSIELVIQ